MYEETNARQNDRIVVMAGAATLSLTALILAVCHLFFGGTPMTAELPLTETMTLPVIPTGRGWDLLVAPIWVMFMVRYSLDHRRDVHTAAVPLVGLLTGAAAWLFLWGQAGILGACAMPFAAVAAGRLMNLFDDAEHRKDGGRADPFNAGAAVYACVAFGLGMLVPFAVMHGFLLAFMIPFMGYLLVSFLLCAVLFGTLGALRLARNLIKVAGRSDV